MWVPGVVTRPEGGDVHVPGSRAGGGPTPREAGIAFSTVTSVGGFPGHGGVPGWSGCDRSMSRVMLVHFLLLFCRGLTRLDSGRGVGHGITSDSRRGIAGRPRRARGCAGHRSPGPAAARPGHAGARNARKWSPMVVAKAASSMKGLGLKTSEPVGVGGPVELAARVTSSISHRAEAAHERGMLERAHLAVAIRGDDRSEGAAGEFEGQSRRSAGAVPPPDRRARSEC